MSAEAIRSSFVERLRECVDLAGSGNELSRRTGIPRRTLENYLSGDNEPKLSALVSIADAAAVSLEWLAKGREPKHPHDVVASAPLATADIDEEFMGRVVDAIQRLYKEEKISLPGVELGRLAAEKYKEISASSADMAERAAMLKLITTQLRNELRTAPGADATTSKRRA